MATTKVSELAELTSPDGAEQLLVNDGGTSKRLLVSNLPTGTPADDSITYAKIQNVSATDRILGRDSAGAGDVEEITVANVLTMLNVEAGATADQSNAEIVAAVEAGTNSNTFTDADHSKLNAIEAAADVTDATNVTAAGALMDSECAGLAALKLTTGTFLTADQTKLDAIEASADVTDTTNVTAAGALMDSELAGIAAVKATTGTFLTADQTKLDAIEAAADVTDATNVAAAGAGMLTVDQAWTGSQRATLVTDNDGSFDLNAGQNFKCTPAGGLTLTFTNFANGQSGYIILVNSGGHAIARHADSIADANFATTVSAAGTYIISYISDGTDAFLTNSAIMA